MGGKKTKKTWWNKNESIKKDDALNNMLGMIRLTIHFMIHLTIHYTMHIWWNFGLSGNENWKHFLAGDEIRRPWCESNGSPETWSMIFHSHPTQRVRHTHKHTRAHMHTHVHIHTRTHTHAEKERESVPLSAQPSTCWFDVTIDISSCKYTTSWFLDTPAFEGHFKTPSKQQLFQ